MFYFAYGSNLWLQQMARRCPQSRYIGRAILPDYRWQINERGYANVIHCVGSSVHGMVYTVDAKDEAHLDRYEGVHSGDYSKAYLDVFLYPAAPDLQKRSGDLIQALSAFHDGPPTEQRPIVQQDILVYLSTDYISAGDPHKEYIHRINSGVRDAVALGVPLAFFENAVRSSIPAKLD